MRHLSVGIFAVTWAALILCLAGPASGQLADGCWPTEAFDAQRTSRSPDCRGPDDPQLLWKVALGADSFGASVGPDGTIYATTTAGRLHAVTPDGQTAWTFDTGDAIRKAPTIGADGTIYVGSNDHHLYAVNPDGTQKWRFDLGGESIYAPAIGDAGEIYCKSLYSYRMYCLNPDGTERWSRSLNTGGRPTLLHNGNVVTKVNGSGRNTIVCLDPDGVPLWSKSMPTSTGSVVVGSDDTIYVGQYDWDLYAIRPTDGETLWTSRMAHSACTHVAIGSDGSLFVGADGSLEKVRSDGLHLWTILDVAQRAGAPVIDADDTLYLSDGQLGNNIRAFTPDGELLWTFRGDEPSWHFAQPALGDGVLYAPSWSYNHTDGYLYAIVPEPATMTLVGLGLSAMVVRRRRIGRRAA